MSSGISTYLERYCYYSGRKLEYEKKIGSMS
jgi:hypothetical protein